MAEAPPYSWFSFGSNQSGLLLHAHCDDAHEPVQISLNEQLETKHATPHTETPDTAIASFLCSGQHVCLLTRSGRVFLAGQLNSSPHTNLVPFQWENAADSRVKLAGVGWDYTVLVDGADNVHYVPNNALSVPRCIFSNNEHRVHVLAVSCGYKHVLWLATHKDNGKQALYGYGENKYGQLGTGDHAAASTPTPVPIPGSAEITALSCGWLHSLLLDKEGKVYACGSNKHAQLALHEEADSKTISRSNEWRAVRSLPPVAAVSTGWSHCLAVTGDGRVYGWGRADRGQIGRQIDAQSQLQLKRVSKPSLVFSSDNPPRISSVHCGSEHSLLAGERDVFFCGWNEHGNSGLGHTQNIFQPEPIPSLHFSDTSASASGQSNFLVSTGGAAVFLGRRKVE